MTGVYSDKPQSLPGPLLIIRDPATTTARSGMISGLSSLAE